ncbi:MAG: cell division protein ZapA [Proteobacteria bacterium]|jgi:cell division protein ZapA|nr:cell division protein ZapA [Pseudomonadota bacterium]
MVNVNVKFNSRDYLLACEDGQEKELEKLTIELNKKFEKLKSDLGNLGEGKLLLITAIQTMDEMFSIKETMQKLKKHNKELEEKFKEIKDLSIQYKDDRDREVRNLNEELAKLKIMIEQNESSYSEVLNKVSSSIDNFLSKAS